MEWQTALKSNTGHCVRDQVEQCANAPATDRRCRLRGATVADDLSETIQQNAQGPESAEADGVREAALARRPACAVDVGNNPVITGCGSRILRSCAMNGNSWKALAKKAGRAIMPISKGFLVCSALVNMCSTSKGSLVQVQYRPPLAISGCGLPVCGRSLFPVNLRHADGV